MTCGIPIPDDAILRINLAWCDSLEELDKQQMIQLTTQSQE